MGITCRSFLLFDIIFFDIILWTSKMISREILTTTALLPAAFDLAIINSYYWLQLSDTLFAIGNLFAMMWQYPPTKAQTCALLFEFVPRIRINSIIPIILIPYYNPSSFLCYNHNIQNYNHNHHGFDHLFVVIPSREAASDWLCFIS